MQKNKLGHTVSTQKSIIKMEPSGWRYGQKREPRTFQFKTLCYSRQSYSGLNFSLSSFLKIGRPKQKVVLLLPPSMQERTPLTFKSDRVKLLGSISAILISFQTVSLLSIYGTCMNRILSLHSSTLQE